MGIVCVCEVVLRWDGDGVCVKGVEVGWGWYVCVKGVEVGWGWCVCEVVLRWDGDRVCVCEGC